MSRDDEHRAFLNWLVDFLKTIRADALLVAGDLFDTGNPPSTAQNLYFSFLSRVLAEIPHLQVVTIGGNHDSPSRLDAPAPLLNHFRVRQVGGFPGQNEERAIVPIMNMQGDCEAWVLAVPFLRPADLSAPFSTSLENLAAGETQNKNNNENENENSESLQESTARVYLSVIEKARAFRKPHQALIAMGHCFMAGGEISELSERKIQRGNQDVLGAEIFPDDLTYVALGHLHKAQRVGKKEHVRYCGSPIPLSFSERNYKHQVLVLTLENGKLVQVEEQPVPRLVDLWSVPASAAPLPEVLKSLEELALKFPRNTSAEPVQGALQPLLPLLEVRVELEQPEPQLRMMVEKALEGAAVHLVRIETRMKARALQNGSETGFENLSDGQSHLLELAEFQPADLFKQKYAQTYSDTPSEELMSTFFELMALVQSKEAP